jgi:hypothetical protein
VIGAWEPKRDAMTSPMESLDDTGVAHYLCLRKLSGDNLASSELPRIPGSMEI